MFSFPKVIQTHVLTDAHQVHEAVHGVADLEEQVLALPLGRGTERRPHEPWDAGDEEERTEHRRCNLHLLDHCQRNRLPLHGDKDTRVRQLYPPMQTTTDHYNRHSKSCKYISEW